MRDHFEIGVPLAYGHGVARGMAQAQQDVLAATRATPAGVFGIQHLQDAGVRALSVAGMGHAPSAGIGHAGFSRLPPGEVASHDLVNTTIAAASPVLARTAGDSLTRTGPSLEPASPMARAASTALAENLRHVPEADTHMSAGWSKAVRNIRLDQWPSGGPPGAVAFGEKGAPDLMLRGTGGGQPPPTETNGRADNSRPAPFVVAADMDRQSARRVPLAQFVARYGDASPESAQRGVALGAGSSLVSEMPTSRRSASAPMSPALLPAGGQSPGLANPGDRTDGDSDAPDAEAVQQSRAQTAQGPTEGDVFLDGALVGRWMSRLLSREAGRASAGPTGFDPRRNAVLPGATVGS